MSSPDLQRSIAHLYRTFSGYSACGMTGCADCTSDQEGQHLAAKALKELTPQDLKRYAFKAMTTWGSVDDFKHFLPRIFELVASGELQHYVDIEVVLSKPQYGQWHQWPAREQDAVDRFFRTLWLNLLNTYPHGAENADSCLCAIGRSVDDLCFYLDAWSVACQRPAMMHLAEFIAWNSPGVDRKGRGPRLANAFWKDRPAQAKQVIDWLLDPARMQQVERAFFDYADDDPQGLLSDAFNQLGILRDTVAAAPPKSP